MRAQLILALLHLLAWLPLPVNHALGSLFGWLLYLIPNRQRQIAQSNLQYCFPQHTAKQQQQMLRRSLIETGKTVTEVGILWFRSKNHVLALVRQVSGKQHTLHAEGGILLATPHLGAWEMAGLYAAQHFALTTLYRPPKMEGLAAAMRKARERTGANLVPTSHQGVRALYQCLAKGDAVGILPDQDPGKEAGVFAPFFELQANTMTLLPRLVQRGKAKMVFGFAERLPWGRGYHVHFLAAPEELYQRDAKRACTAMNRSVEACIQQCPEQYLWVYKRFKTRPEGEKKLY